MSSRRELDAAAPPPLGGFEGCDLPADEALLAEGWERRCVTDAAKSREMADFYAELGFDVHLVPADSGSLCAACEGCKDMVETFNAVYVRRSGS